MAAISCSKCNTMTERAGYPTWAIVVSICFFPGGIAFLAGRTQADYLRSLRVYLERLITTTSSLALGIETKVTTPAAPANPSHCFPSARSELRRPVFQTVETN